MLIAAARRHSVGVRPDGRVESAGHPLAPNSGRSHTVGLLATGNVIAAGWNGDGQCEVAEWADIVAIAAGWRRTLALRADGTVLCSSRLRRAFSSRNCW